MPTILPDLCRSTSPSTHDAPDSPDVSCEKTLHQVVESAQQSHGLLLHAVKDISDKLRQDPQLAAVAATSPTWQHLEQYAQTAPSTHQLPEELSCKEKVAHLQEKMDALESHHSKAMQISSDLPHLKNRAQSAHLTTGKDCDVDSVPLWVNTEELCKFRHAGQEASCDLNAEPYTHICMKRPLVNVAMGHKCCSLFTDGRQMCSIRCLTKHVS